MKIGMSGKFMPCKFDGAKGNEQALGYRRSRLRACPCPACRMPDMDDLNRFIGRAVKDLVAIPPNDMDANTRIVGTLIRVRLFGDQVDASALQIPSESHRMLLHLSPSGRGRIVFAIRVRGFQQTRVCTPLPNPLLTGEGARRERAHTFSFKREVLWHKWRVKRCAHRPGCDSEGIGQSPQVRRAPARGSAASWKAAAFPECFDVVISRERTSACSIYGRVFLVAQSIDARSPRLDLARKLGQLFLVFVWPGRHPVENVFDGWAHGNILSSVVRILRCRGQRSGAGARGRGSEKTLFAARNCSS